MSKAIQELSGRAVVHLVDDIDTDRITPARFLKCVTFDGLGETVFYDERFGNEGETREHPLNDQRFAGASVLVSGRNFGCGSSREHAPQALFRAGFRVILAESFAEIFFGNSVTLGLVCLRLSRKQLESIQAAVEADPSALLAVDLESKVLSLCGESYTFELPEVSREAFLSGQYDPLSVLLEGAEQVRQTYDGLAYERWVRS
ncbi:MAG: 3-isopropylmalate dehydratase small subunit [Myxococcota bacterium]|nr:3-isopropylmalate dehydratase small subunit [Myxococcota bacterium]